MTYKEYLQSEGWNRRRWAKIRRDGKFVPETNQALIYCDRCGGMCLTRRVHVHHTNYDTVGDERFGDLEILCEACHEQHHGVDKQQVRKSKLHERILRCGFEIQAGTSIEVRKLPAGQWSKYVAQRTTVITNVVGVRRGVLVGKHAGYLVKLSSQDAHIPQERAESA